MVALRNELEEPGSFGAFSYYKDLSISKDLSTCVATRPSCSLDSNEFSTIGYLSDR